MSTPRQTSARQSSKSSTPERLPSSTAPHSLRLSRPRLQRQCACGGTCESCRKKRKPELQRRSLASAPVLARESRLAPPIVHQVLRSPGQPLQARTRTEMESRLGHDLSQVRIHDGPRAAQSAAAVGAEAYTVGRHVAFGAGNFAPGSCAGRQLLAHELAHTLQQGQAESLPSQLTIGPRDDRFERQAETAAASGSAMAGSRALAPAVPSVQRRMPEGGQGPGDPLPYREAKELLDCMRIMKDSEHCREMVLGEKPVLPTAGCGWFAVKMKPFVTGVEGTVEFTPHAKRCPKCKLIRLIQTLRIFEKPGQDYKWPGKDKPRNQVKTAGDKTKGILPDYHVDHEPPNCTKGAGCSAYYRDHWANPSNSQDGSNDGTTAKVASLWDRPRGDKDDIFQFETCARCDDDGKYLGCVDWGWSADGTGKVTLAASNEHGSPTATFLAAVTKFDKFYGN